MPIIELTIQNGEDLDATTDSCENAHVPIVEVTLRNQTKGDHVHVVEMSDAEFNRFKLTVESDLEFSTGVGFECIDSEKSSVTRIAFDLKSFRCYRVLSTWPA